MPHPSTKRATNAQLAGPTQKSTDVTSIAWATMPGRTRWVRIGRRRVKKWVSRCNVILRNLAPSTGFNPREVWLRELERERKEEETAAAEGAASDQQNKAGGGRNARGGRGGGGGGRKHGQQQPKKADLIRMRQDETRELERYERDEERILNKGGAPLSLNGAPAAAARRPVTENTAADLTQALGDIQTKRGKFRLMLTILDIAVRGNDRTLAYDVLWALESTPLYVKGKADYEAVKALMQAASAAPDGGAAASSGGKKKKKKGGAGGAGGAETQQQLLQRANAQRTWECDVYANFYRSVRDVMKWRAAEDMVVKQLTDMSDRLPPLSRFVSDFRLDAWQMQLIRWINAGRSCIVSAPTSSGKTIISTYVAALSNDASSVAAATAQAKQGWDGEGDEPDLEAMDDYEEELLKRQEEDENEEANRVLFVVPTEPLVWQVGAHFGKHLVSMDIALVTDQMTYSTHVNIDRPPRVVIGTPLALEAALTKVRGKVSWLETDGKIDAGELPGGFHHYKWAVFDEIHSLNGTTEGAALQRLIRLLKCNFLALSATIGNAEELRTWMEHVRGEQLDVEVMDAERFEAEAAAATAALSTKEEIVQEQWRSERRRLVKKICHEGRFINLQRHVWMGQQQSRGGLQHLHPLAAVSLDLLNDGRIDNLALPFTSRDSYALWLKLQELFVAIDAEDQVADVDPHAFFPSVCGVADDDTSGPRLTLEHTKMYEDALREKLKQLSHSHPEQIARLLDQFECPDVPEQYDIADLVLELRERELLPCVCFHLNTFEAITLFKRLLAGLERRQLERFPDMWPDLERRQRMLDSEFQMNLASSRARGANKGGDRDRNQEDEGDDRDPGESLEKENLDFTAPHTDFCMGTPLSRKEFDKIVEEVKWEDRFGGDVAQHALIRALRRGIGIVMNEVAFQEYRRTVMRLAMQGKLAVVFSDESLAFGVNMPFRSCVFCSDMGGDLDALTAQQMSGRAGRRGLDTQGHYIFAGTSPDSVRMLMRGEIPAITGNEPWYPTMFFHDILSDFTVPDQVRLLGNQSLNQFLDKVTPTENGIDRSRRVLEYLGMVEEAEDGVFEPVITRGLNKHVYHMMWALRETATESLYLGHLLPILADAFTARAAAASERESAALANSAGAAATAGGDKDSVTERQQIEFTAFVCMIFDRVPITDPDTPTILDHPFVSSREQCLARLQDWQQRMVAFQETLAANELTQDLTLPIPAEQPTDGDLFASIVDRHYAIGIPMQRKQSIKRRLVTLGDVLMQMHNHLFPDKDNCYPNEPEKCCPMSTRKYSSLANIIRKAHSRVRYLVREVVDDDLDFEDVSSYEFYKNNRGDVATAAYAALDWCEDVAGKAPPSAAAGAGAGAATGVAMASDATGNGADLPVPPGGRSGGGDMVAYDPLSMSGDGVSAEDAEQEAAQMRAAINATRRAEGVLDDAEEEKKEKKKKKKKKKHSRDQEAGSDASDREGAEGGAAVAASATGEGDAEAARQERKKKKKEKKEKKEKKKKKKKSSTQDQASDNSESENEAVAPAAPTTG